MLLHCQKILNFVKRTLLIQNMEKLFVIKFEVRFADLEVFYLWSTQLKKFIDNNF